MIETSKETRKKVVADAVVRRKQEQLAKARLKKDREQQRFERIAKKRVSKEQHELPNDMGILSAIDFPVLTPKISLTTQDLIEMRSRYSSKETKK